MFIKINKHAIPFQQYFLCLIIISAFTGSLWLFEIGPIHIFPFRIFLILMWLLFIGAIIFISNGRLNLSHIKVKTYLKFFALWLGYSFISMTWAADQIEALRNIIFLFMGISIVFFLVYYFRNLNYLKWLYWLWVLIFVALIPIGIWEVMTGNHLAVSGLSKETRPLALFGPTTVFYNQNDFATYIALTLPMTLVWIRYYPKLYSRVLGVLVFIAGLFLLMMTTSRSCFIAVFMGLAFWFIFLLNLNNKIKTLAVGAFICILFILAFPNQIKDSLTIVENQMNSLSAVGSQAGDDLSIDIRRNLIKNALYFTVQSVGFGVGAGNAEYYMDHYKIYPTGGITNVHNWWAEIAVNYGIFIFVGYVVLYITLIFNLWRAYKRLMNHTEKMICEALLVGLVSFFMASISSSSIIAFPPQWIFFGFALAFLNYTRIKALERCNPYEF